jgi:tetratricopeptide (TPR) repeat protein
MPKRAGCLWLGAGRHSAEQTKQIVLAWLRLDLSAFARREPAFFPCQYNLARIYAQSGRCEEAIAACKWVVQISQVRQAEAAVAYARALAGHTEEALEVRERLEKFASSAYLPAPQSAMMPIGFGDLDIAVGHLQQGMTERSPFMIYVKPTPSMIRSAAIRHSTNSSEV